MLLHPPAGSEKKPDFTTVPDAIRRQLETLCGAVISAAETAFGGLSGSAGFVLTLDNGTKVFAKGTHPEETAHGAANLSQEIDAYQRLPSLQKLSPRYIGKVWDGDEDGWMLGVWEHIEHDNKYASWPRMLDCVRDFQPDAAAKTVLESVHEHNYIGQFFSPEKKWLRLQQEEKTRAKFVAMFPDAVKAQTWLESNLPALCALQEKAAHLDFVPVLLHGDLRRDNFLFTPERAYVIDWPNACVGPAAFDLCFLCTNLEALGEGEAGVLLREANADMEQVVPVLAAQAGYFADQAYRAVPDRMPRLRWMQKSMLLSGLRTLARLGIIESPPDLTGQKQ